MSKDEDENQEEIPRITSPYDYYFRNKVDLSPELIRDQMSLDILKEAREKLIEHEYKSSELRILQAIILKQFQLLEDKEKDIKILQKNLESRYTGKVVADFITRFKNQTQIITSQVAILNRLTVSWHEKVKQDSKEQEDIEKGF